MEDTYVQLIVFSILLLIGIVIWAIIYALYNNNNVNNVNVDNNIEHVNHKNFDSNTVTSFDTTQIPASISKSIDLTVPIAPLDQTTEQVKKTIKNPTKKTTKKYLSKDQDTIPKRIYQTQEFRNVPINMKKAMQTIIDHNPDYGYKYYNDSQARSFIAKHMDHKVLECYDKLIPGAYRADLFRYCLLYIKGGVYIDSAFVCHGKLSDHILPIDKFICALDLPCVDDAGHVRGIYNAFIASKPLHPLIKDIIDLVISRIDNEVSASDGPECCCLYLSGPVAMADAFKSYYGVDFIDKDQTFEDCKLFYHMDSKVLNKDIVIFSTKYPEYRDDMKWYNSGQHYGTLWNKGEVYRKDNNIIPLGLNYKPMCPQNIGWDNNWCVYPKNVNKNTMRIEKYKHHSIIATSNNIPYIIHQTNEYHYVPEHMKYEIDNIRQMNPEYTHIYYDNKDIEDFIMEHMDERTYKSFKTLIPGAYKADFFRYCVLYIKGGIYVDSAFVQLVPFEKIILPTDKFISVVDGDSNNLYNAFIACVPGHPVLKMTIDLMIKRIENREYGSSDLHVTGPCLLGEVFRNMMGTNNLNTYVSNDIRLFSHVINWRCSSNVVKYGNEEYFYTKYPSYNIDKTWYNSTQNYALLWKNRMIYK